MQRFGAPLLVVDISDRPQRVEIFIYIRIDIRGISDWRRAIALLCSGRVGFGGPRHRGRNDPGAGPGPLEVKPADSTVNIKDFAWKVETGAFP